MKTNDISLTQLEFFAAESPAAEKPAVAFRHIPALDGLRGIAVLIVMIYHLEFLVPELGIWVKGGFLGVDIFFVLSGFLITSVLLKEFEETRQISLKNFYLRRFLRLMPAYWLFLIVLYFFAYYLLPPPEASIVHSNNNFLYSFLYLTNWRRALDETVLTGNLNHTWSLAIEEQFYIFWSLLIFFVFRERQSRKRIVFLTFGLIFALVLWRIARVQAGASISALYYSTDSRIDALLFGCLASMIFVWRMGTTAFFQSRLFDYLAFSGLLTAICTMLIVSYEDIVLYYGVLSVFSASIALVILWLVTRKAGKVHRILEMNWLRWIGHISYGLYLWHYLFYSFAKKIIASPLLQSLAGIALAFLAASLSFYLLEKPFLKLKNKLTTNETNLVKA